MNRQRSTSNREHAARWHAPGQSIVGNWKFFVLVAAAGATIAAGVLIFRGRIAGRAPGAIAGEENVVVRTNDDHVEVFRRAFWREPNPDDRIINAERREWVSETDGTRHWQWFLVVEPGKALSTWLRDANPFHLARVERPSFAFVDSPPTWFPRTADPAKCVIQQAADGAMTLVFDPKKNLLYATDRGHGFAAAPKQHVTALPVAHNRDSDLNEWQPRRRLGSDAPPAEPEVSRAALPGQ